MQTLKIQLPDFVYTDIKEITFIIASKLYEQGKISSGQAAEMVGISKRTFIELLGNYDISLFNYPAEEIETDLKNA